MKACDAGDAKRKGKVERPFRDLKRGLLSELDLDPPEDIGELNRRAGRWLDRYFHSVPHATTKEAPAARLVTERPLLGAVAPVRFDTAVRDTRRVGRVPLVEWDTVFYSAPPELAGKLIEVRQPVGYDVVELRFLGQLVALHERAPQGSPPQWLPEHRQRAEAIVLGRRRLGVLDGVGNSADRRWPSSTIAATLDLEDGDYDVAVPDLAVMGAIGPHPDLSDPASVSSQDIAAGGAEPEGTRS